MDKEIKDRIDAIRQGLSDDRHNKTEIGLFPRNWRVAKLSDIAEKLTQTAGTDSYETVSISAGIGFVNQAEKFGKELSGKQYAKYIVLHKGDFSYNKGNSNKYPQGCIYRLKDRETAAAPNVFENFRIQDECAEFYDHLFVSGFLNRQLLKKINHGVRNDGLLNLMEKDFYSCLLPVPPLVEQEKISEILDHHDKLIKLCEAKVDEYKSLKKTCLNKMFPQKESAVPEIRFPGFTEAWEQRKLDTITDVRDGTHDSPQYVETGHPFITSKNVKDGFINYEDIQYVSDKDYEEINKRSKVDKNDILMGMIGTIGNIALVRETPDFAIKNVALIKDIGDVYYRYLYHCLQSNSVAHQLDENLDGGTQKFIALNKIREIVIPVPSEHEQHKIGDYMESLDDLITLHQREVEEYTKFKKAMTQLLLTGIVRVKT